MQTKTRLNRVSFEPSNFHPYAILHEGAFIGWVLDVPGVPGHYRISGIEGMDDQEFTTLGDIRIAIENYYASLQRGGQVTA